jgi:hypothetical protein
MRKTIKALITDARMIDMATKFTRVKHKLHTFFGERRNLQFHGHKHAGQFGLVNG